MVKALFVQTVEAPLTRVAARFLAGLYRVINHFDATARSFGRRV